jgi:hypothetical protein
MKKAILIIACAASISAYALPTYEPFTEYAAAAAATGTNALSTAGPNQTLAGVRFGPTP